MSKSILAFGETLWDLLPRRRVLGGAPFNFAYRACCLGDRGRIVTRLGRDELGREAWESVIRLGVDASLIQWDDDRPTGTVQVSFDSHNDPDYFIVPDVAYDRIEENPALLEAAAEADCICFGSLAQRAPRSRQTLLAMLDASPNSLKLFDVNLRKDCFCRSNVEDSLMLADILRCNADETAGMGALLELSCRDVPDFCWQALRRWSLSHCVVTLGERGAYAASADGQQAYVPGYSVNVVDSLGAGDAFTAAFVHGLLGDQELAQCLELGNILGAMVSAQEGATQPIDPAGLKEFAAASHHRIYDDHLRELLVL
jgi:fructokinase